MEHMLASKITAWCKRQGEMSESQVVAVTYGIELFFDTVLKLIGLILLGIVFGRLPEVLLSIACFSSLRSFAGGVHMETSLGCFLSMVFVCFASCLGAEVITGVPAVLQLVISLLNIVLNVLFAPFFTQNNPIEDKKILKRKRAGAVALSLILMAAAWVIPDWRLKLLILIPVTIESLSILPCWHRGINR